MENTVLCPLDGRYRAKLALLRQYMDEASFASARIKAETAWLEVLSSLKLPHLKPLTAAEKKQLDRLSDITEKDVAVLTALEQTGYRQFPATKHDVKAVEYFLKLKLQSTSLKDRLSWLHFALTSEDVNSAAYAMLLADGIEKVLLPTLGQLSKALSQLARKEARSVMLARTHGQPAVPTTFGKEIRVFDMRLRRQLEQLKKQQISCKFGGAVGNYNAHVAAFSKVNWLRVAKQFVAKLNENRHVKIVLSPLSTQVDNRDTYAELFDNLRRCNVILTDFSQDMWHYISAGLVRQKVVAGEVGSSTMPQKVNPIDFENAEGNLQLANALFSLFSQKLPISRLQRDLSDSTVLRNMGVAFGYAQTAYVSLLNGLSKIAFDRKVAEEELYRHPEVLAEGIQTILRANGVANAYELLRDFTRGQKMSVSLLTDFIDGLDVPAPVKMQLHQLEITTYTGYAEKLAEGNHD